MDKKNFNLESNNKEIRFDISVSNIICREKPDDNQVSKISNSFETKNLNQKELEQYCSEIPYSIAPGVFNGNRNQSNWISQQCIFIDFDGTKYSDEVIDKLEKYGIKYNFIYYTFSHVDMEKDMREELRKKSENEKNINKKLLGERFRIVIILSKKVDNKKTMNLILKAFKYLFYCQIEVDSQNKIEDDSENKKIKFIIKEDEGCDLSCLEISKMFYPGKNLIHKTYEPQSLEELLAKVEVWMFTFGGEKKGRNAINDINYIDSNIIIDNDNQYIKKMKSYQNIDMWNKLVLNCDIFQHFVNGEWLYHEQLFGIATNMSCLKGGVSKFEEIINKHISELEETYDLSKISLASYCRYKNYSPKNLKDFSENENDKLYKNFYEIIAREKNYFKIINTGQNYKLPSFDQAKEWFNKSANTAKYICENASKLDYKDIDENINNMINEITNIKIQNQLKKIRDNYKNGIYSIIIFNTPCGFGKTEWIVKQKNVQILGPTHMLLEEIDERMDNQIERHLMQKKPHFTDNDLNVKMQYYYGIGIHENCSVMIRDIEKNDDKKFKSEDQKLAKIYLQNRTAEIEEDVNLITTHAYGIHKVIKEIVIVDEDMIQHIFKISNINRKYVLGVLKKYIKSIDNEVIKETFQELFDSITNAEGGNVVNKNKFMDYDREKLKKYIKSDNNTKNTDEKIDYVVAGDIFSFLNSDSFIKSSDSSDRIEYFIHQELYDSTFYFLFTATPLMPMYEKAYSERLVYFDFSEIEMKGKIIQHLDFSCSKKSLDNQNIINEIKKHLIPGSPVITFKDYKENFPDNDTEMHYGALEGLNQYNNMDIYVIGTQHLNEFTYKLYGNFLGYPINQESDLEIRLVEFNNCKFNFRTYENKEMQNLQMTMIENINLQAIGRIRPIQNEKTAIVFSNLPIKGAEYKFLDGRKIEIEDRIHDNTNINQFDNQENNINNNNNDVDFEETA